MGPVFFPLDDELGLGAGSVSPFLHEAIARLGTWMPFERVPAELSFFTHTSVSIETARRLTEGAGAALVTAETQEVERLERELPDSPAGPPIQQLSVDGAMVPLRKGEWAEVKTVALGTVGRRVTPKGEEVVQTTDLTYFSRLSPAEQFGRLATIATHRAGTSRAGTVVAVVDGADWLQGFIDLHRVDAVRILDFPHAAEHLGNAARATWSDGSPSAAAWLGEQLHDLKHEDPGTVLAALAALPASTTEAQKTRDQVIAYLTKRRTQIAYAEFQELGYPIGDGIVESANKLVVEQRLKGAGMHWTRANVNPMVALRACACSDQWATGWGQITTELRRGEQERRRSRHAARQAAKAPPVEETIITETAAPETVPTQPVKQVREKTMVNGRPTANHPWKQPLWPERARSSA